MNMNRLQQLWGEWDRRGSLTTLALVLFIFVLLACNCPKPKGNNSNNGNSNNSNQTGKNTEPDNGDFKVVHVPLQDHKYDSIDQAIRENRTLEDAADQLNEKLALPKDITLQAKSCGQPNAFFNPDDNSLTICYELMEHFYNLAKSQGKSEQESNIYMNDAITFVFCHELGHALIHNFKLPVTGREEDVADQLATYVSCEELGERGERAAAAGAMSFAYQSKGGGQPGDQAYADEHSLDQQRFYNILCWLYGHDPNKHAKILTSGALPGNRAQRCPGEYKQIVTTWQELLKAYLKD
jgi:hypothetical protein